MEPHGKQDSVEIEGIVDIGTTNTSRQRIAHQGRDTPLLHITVAHFNLHKN